MLAYVRFESLRLLRQPAFIVFTVGIPLALFLVDAAIFRSVGGPGIAVSQYLMASMAAFVYLFGELAEGVTLRALQWLALAAATWLGALPFTALGVLIGSATNVHVAQPLDTGTMFFLNIFGGIFIPLRALPATMAHLAKALLSYRHAQLGWSPPRSSPIATPTATPDSKARPRRRRCQHSIDTGPRRGGPRNA